MVKKIAFLFPGQASQYVGMAKEFYDNYAVAKELFGMANDVLGFDITRLCFEGPEERLKLTEYTQPAILLCSIVTKKVLDLSGIKPDIGAGHSLGEYSALVAAGTLDLAAALRIVRARGKFMQEAVPEGKGAMAALLGIERKKVEEGLRKIENGIVEAANFNSPGQIVISGEKEAVEKAVEVFKKEGAKKAVFLPVSAPFHCRLMEPAEEKLSAYLDDTEFRDLEFPIITNVDARVINKGKDARDSLRRQVSRPVLWEDSVLRIKQEGINLFVEVGPGRVLSGLVRQIDREAVCLNVEDKKSLEKTLEVLHH